MHSNMADIMSVTIIDTSNDTGNATADARPRKKQRKQRPCLSCQECRRLKMKCDREVPCSNCVRRNRTRFCHTSSNDVLTADQGHTAQGPASMNTASTMHPDGAAEDGPRAPQNQAMLARDHCDSGVHHQQVSEGASLPNDFHSQNTSERESEPQLGWRHAPAPFTYTLNFPCDSPNQAFQNPAPLQPNQQSGISGSIPNTVGSSNETITHSVEDSAPDGSYGTLVLSEGGRSRYLGPTAGSEWLKDSESHDVAGANPLSITRPSSPQRLGGLNPAPPKLPPGHLVLHGFPFNPSPNSISTRDLLSHLPLRDEAWSLIESYYRYCAWHHDVAPRHKFEKTFARIYSIVDGTLLQRPNPQELALVFVILAQGTVYNIEMAYDASATEHWLHLAEIAMVRGDFLSNNTIAGLQTLHLMAHLHLNWDKGSRGDKAWSLWGLVMRLIQAMGMHRDGARWNLPEDVVEERRKVFWECHAADTFQAHCFSRPSAINPEHCDTMLPLDPSPSLGGKSYFTLRFELSKLSSEILNMAMRVRKPHYSEVLKLDSRLIEFERLVPFSLRSRTAYLSMPSLYPLHENAVQASPEPSRTSVAVTFQRMNLAFNISETFINLHRPYYAKALYAEAHIKSAFTSSFLTVLERCAIIIALVRDVQARFPNVSTRQWNLWYHVFGSAICLSTLLLRDPSNAMASFVIAQIDVAIELFGSLIEHGGGTAHYRANLAWLKKLRGRVLLKVQAAVGVPRSDAPGNPEQNGKENQQEGDDVELVGWRTRLIERAGDDHHISKITKSSSISSATPGKSVVGLRDQIFLEHSQSNPGTTAISKNNTTPNSTNDLLHDFWDPILLQDVFEAQHEPNPHDTFLANGQAWWENPVGFPLIQ